MSSYNYGHGDIAGKIFLSRRCRQWCIRARRQSLVSYIRYDQANRDALFPGRKPSENAVTAA